jgi:hypothetical protein
MSTPDDLAIRADQYVRRFNARREGKPWTGKDGHVWRTSRPSALKIHERQESYRAERDAYIRLRDLQIRNLDGFSIPEMYGYDDGLLAIDMEIVFPPFIVDFASAHLDFPPDLIEDEGHTLFDLIRERFDDRADDVIALFGEFAARAGIYLSDPHAGNIKFGTP